MNFIILALAVFAASASAAVVKRDAGTVATGQSDVEKALAKITSSINEMLPLLSQEKITEAVKKASEDTAKVFSGVNDKIKAEIEKAGPEVKSNLESVKTNLESVMEDLKKNAPTVETFEQAISKISAKAKELSDAVAPQLKNTFEQLAEASKTGMKNLMTEVHEISPDKHTHKHDH